MVASLTLNRHFNAAPERLWWGWTAPEALVQWFAPKPVVIPRARVDAKPGGIYAVAMRLPDGSEVDDAGCILVAEPGRRLVFTDALGPGFVPKGSGFITAEITWTPHANGTRQDIRVLHKDEADRDKHLAMGFEQGWNTAANQLAALLE